MSIVELVYTLNKLPLIVIKEIFIRVVASGKTSARRFFAHGILKASGFTVIRVEQGSNSLGFG
jgi:hypothetical protein